MQTCDHAALSRLSEGSRLFSATGSNFENIAALRSSPGLLCFCVLVAHVSSQQRKSQVVVVANMFVFSVNRVNSLLLLLKLFVSCVCMYVALCVWLSRSRGLRLDSQRGSSRIARSHGKLSQHALIAIDGCLLCLIHKYLCLSQSFVHDIFAASSDLAVMLISLPS